MSVKIPIIKNIPLQDCIVPHALPEQKHLSNHCLALKTLSVNYADTSIRVEFSPEEISPSEMKKAVQSIGYDLIIDEANSQEMKEEASNSYYKQIKINTIGAASFSIPLVIIAMIFMNIPYANYIMMALATPVVFWFGRQFPAGAWKQLKHGTSNMDTLVALSTSIAYIYSAFGYILSRTAS